MSYCWCILGVSEYEIFKDNPVVGPAFVAGGSYVVAP